MSTSCEFCQGNNYIGTLFAPEKGYSNYFLHCHGNYLRIGSEYGEIADAPNGVYIPKEHQLNVETVKINFCPMCGAKL